MASSQDLVEIFGSSGSTNLDTPSNPTHSILDNSSEASASVTLANNIGATLNFLMDEMLAMSKDIALELWDEINNLECVEIEKVEQFQYVKHRFGITATIVEEYYSTL